MYETYCEKIETYIGIDKLQIHYIDCDSFIRIIKAQNVIYYLKNFENIFDFNNFDKNELYDKNE